MPGTVGAAGDYLRAEAMRESFRQAHAYACGSGKLGVGQRAAEIPAVLSSRSGSAKATAPVAAPAPEPGDAARARLPPQHRPSFFLDEDEDAGAERAEARSLLQRVLCAVFGITDGDARLGVIKSHCIHPGSPFYRGSPRPTPLS